MSSHSQRMGVGVELSHPVDVGGRTVDFLRLRRATVGDFRTVEAARTAGGDFAAFVLLIARLSGHSIDDVERIDADDLGGISSALPHVVPPTLIPAWRGA